jgi:hypothetical protein
MRGKRHFLLCNLRCLLRLERWVNIFLHTLQEKGRSPLCTMKCVIKTERWMKFFLHISHEKGRCPLCSLRCIFKLERWVNIFLHTSHEKGRSPVCTLLWISRLEWVVKLLLHTLHEKGVHGLWVVALHCDCDLIIWHTFHNKTLFLCYLHLHFPMECSYERMSFYIFRTNKLLHSVHQEFPQH